MGNREVLGAPVYLDIDPNNGIFIRSAELDHLLNHIPTSELIDTEGSWCPEEANVNFFGQQPTLPEERKEAHFHKAHPVKLDYEKLAPHFAYQSAEIIWETIIRTTQLAKAIIQFPMRKHFKSRFKMLGRP